LARAEISDQEDRGSCRKLARDCHGQAPGLFRLSAFGESRQTASEIEVKLNSFATSAGATREAPSSPRMRVALPIFTAFWSKCNGPSLNRKFITGSVILPFSMRNKPSRVSPVYCWVCGFHEANVPEVGDQQAALHGLDQVLDCRIAPRPSQASIRWKWAGDWSSPPQ